MFNNSRNKEGEMSTRKQDPAPFQSSGVKGIWRSIKGKIFLVFLVTFISILALALLNYFSMNSVRQRLLILERYEDVLNNILEVRRLEKNFLLYDNPDSLQESLAHLRNMRELLDTYSEDINKIIGEREYRELLDTFEKYETATLTASQGGLSDNDGIRALGKRLMESAQNMLEKKRERIHRAISRTSYIPFTSLAIIGLLMVMVVELVSMGLLRPLNKLKITTQRVARGDFRPIPMDPKQLTEISALVAAFNRMAYELDTNHEDLVQARKIAALGTFTAGIAHELNNPINNISLTAETMQELYEEQLDEDGREMIQDIIAQADRAGEIVKNLLDFSRTEHPVLKHLQVRKVIASTTNLLKNQFMVSGVRLEVDIPGDIPPLRGDLRNLQQVFMNLLLNAMHAMPGGGAIAIRAREAEGMVRIDVEDQGTGIDPEVIQNIFEPFFTTKEVGKGTGLGLSVTYSIVQRHGGRMEVKSEPGKGSVFSVYIPESEKIG